MAYSAAVEEWLKQYKTQNPNAGDSSYNPPEILTPNPSGTAYNLESLLNIPASDIYIPSLNYQNQNFNYTRPAYGYSPSPVIQSLYPSGQAPSNFNNAYTPPSMPEQTSQTGGMSGQKGSVDLGQGSVSPTRNQPIQAPVYHSTEERLQRIGETQKNLTPEQAIGLRDQGWVIGQGGNWGLFAMPPDSIISPDSERAGFAALQSFGNTVIPSQAPIQAPASIGGNK